MPCRRAARCGQRAADLALAGRGDILIKQVYFAAGVSHRGIFLYSLDAETGEVVWLNDGSGHLDAHPQVQAAAG